MIGKFSNSHKRCIREEDYEANNRYSNNLKVSFILILVNAIIFILIGLLKEDPLTTGMFGMYFRKQTDHVSLFVQASL